LARYWLKNLRDSVKKEGNFPLFFVVSCLKKIIVSEFYCKEYHEEKCFYFTFNACALCLRSVFKVVFL